MTAHISAQNGSADTTPATTPSLENGYFVASKASTPAMTPSATPSVASDEPARPTAPRTVSENVPALMRNFPKPAEEVDVKAALGRQPGRWTIKGQMEANEQRARLADSEEAAKQKRKQDFEATKKELLAPF